MLAFSNSDNGNNYIEGHIEGHIGIHCPNPTPLKDPYSITGTYFCVSQVRA